MITIATKNINNTPLGLYIVRLAMSEDFLALDEKFEPINQYHPSAINLVHTKPTLDYDRKIEDQLKDIALKSLDNFVDGKIEQKIQNDSYKDSSKILKDILLNYGKNIKLTDSCLKKLNPNRYYDVISTIFLDDNYRRDLNENEVLFTRYKSGLNPQIMPRIDRLQRDLEYVCKNSGLSLKAEYK